MVAFELLKPGCQGYHWILFSKTHFNFLKNNHARIQAKKGEPAQPVRALDAAWTTQSRSRGGDPKLALVALPLRGRTRQKRPRSGLDYLSRNKWLALKF